MTCSTIPQLQPPTEMTEGFGEAPFSCISTGFRTLFASTHEIRTSIANRCLIVVHNYNGNPGVCQQEIKNL